MQLGLGVAVFRANSKNYANQSFLSVSIILAAWLLSNNFAYLATQAGEAAFWIQNASAKYLFMNARYSFMAGSSFQRGSLGSFK